jgi:hypothetical protein
MAIYFPNRIISASGSNKISIPGQIIQVVDNTQTVSTTVTTSAWVEVLSTSITINDASNRIMVEYHLNDRSDQGNGTWSLVYHRILRNGTQVMYSGYNGANANYIGYYARNFLDTPGAGTWTYTASVLAHQGTAWIGTFNSGSVAHYLRLYEIGT